MVFATQIEIFKGEYKMIIRKGQNPFYQEILDDCINRTGSYIAKPPTQWAIAATTTCNLKCVFCPRTILERGGYNFAGDMPFELIHELKDYLHDAKSISVSGLGETFLHKDPEKFLGLLREYAPAASITACTNLNIPMSEERIKFILDKRITLSISMDGATKETYENIRKNGNYDLVRKNIDKINKIRETYPHFDYCVMGFVIVLFKRNIDELLDLIKSASNDNIDYFSIIKPYEVWLRDYAEEFQKENICKYDPDRVKELIIEADILAKKLGIPICGKLVYESIEETSLWQTIQDSMCYDPWNMATVSNEGFVSCCPNMQNHYLGNLHSENIEDIWNGPEIRQLRKNKMDGTIDICCSTCIAGKEHNAWFKCT